MLKTVIKNLLSIMLFLGTTVLVAQEYTSFTRTYPSGDNFRYQTNIKGDLTLIANDIVNRDGGTTSTRPENAYNDTGSSSQYNDRFNMRYIDIDDDPSTFSSSSADFIFDQPECNQIRYAGLYWSATYVRNPDGTRSTDFNEIKVKPPGGSYVDVVADEILFDGGTSTDTSMRNNSPYACYADITSLVTSLTNPSGAFTVANIRASQGAVPGGVAGGWTMVIVFENPALTGKLITTYDGFARVRSQNPQLDINYSGFKTIPVGNVRANIGAAALEGDNRIGGDEMAIRASMNAPGPFYRIQNGLNPSTNFFNSNITINGVYAQGRNPSSINTLGYDTDLLQLPVNTIPNNETDATFRFRSTGDQYFPFFNSFNIEIIEPEVVVEKRVEDVSGEDITGQGVSLGQNIDYLLSFENVGNDNAANFTIRDVLPVNVALDESSIVVPPGVTHTYDPPTSTIIFTIPDTLVTKTSPRGRIRLRVQVAKDCFDFVDACTDIIQNLAYATYQGVTNDNVITDDPSVSDFDSCGFVTPGATNFLLDNLADCVFRSTAQLCGTEAVLDAGDNFDSYIWVRDDNANGRIDNTDTVLNDNDPDNDPSTIVITEVGTYIVDKLVADPCKGFQEIIDVVRFGDSNVHPIEEFINNSNSDNDDTNDILGEIVNCSVDGEALPKIFLCGINDTKPLQVNISNTQSMVWQRLDEGSCASVGTDCPNRSQGCDWSTLGTGSTYNVNTPGEYRLQVTYRDGCFNRFYFNVFQNTLDYGVSKRDVICETEGNITIAGLGDNYGFQLIDTNTNTIAVPFSDNNGPVFNFTTNGAYRVEITQLDSTTGLPIEDACIFSTDEIGIRHRDFQVDVTTTNPTCINQGTIQIDALGVEPNYTYELRLDDGTPAPSIGNAGYYAGHPGGTLIDSETAQPSNTYTFSVNQGDYFVITRTADNCIDVQDISIVDIPNPTLSALITANIGCSAGGITLTRTGGQGNPDFQYAIWSKDGTLLHDPGGSATERQIVENIDPNDYEVNNVFTFGWRDANPDDDQDIQTYFPGEEGTYVFVILDANNCYALSNPVTITDEGNFSIDEVVAKQPSCSGDADGQLTINTLGGIAPFQYSIDNGATYQPTPLFVGLTTGFYHIHVLDSSGCEEFLTYQLLEPFPLSASAGISRDATCDPSGAEARITNVTGGVPPYQYSFDGGSTWDTSSVSILPPGDYSLAVRDAFCDYPMLLTIEGLPTPPIVTLTPEVSYSCDGGGTITATPNIVGYDYRYLLDGVANSPDPNSNVFPNVPPGTYTVSTYYRSQTPPTPSKLLVEDFGYGITIPNPNTTGYFYENQLDNTTPSGAPVDSGRAINDYEYAVTDSIASPFNSWLNPIDHTTGTRDTDGRYLVINIGAPEPGQVIYRKAINDMIANQQITVSMYIVNLIRAGRGGVAPNLAIELRDPANDNVIDRTSTGAIPNNNLWNLRDLSLNPGAFTSLDLVITTNESQVSGNDVAIDDISVVQTPEVCELFVETPVTVLPGKQFAANITGSMNASCHGAVNGSATFEAENFDPVTGFQYSVDNGSTWITSTTSPVTTLPVFGVGSNTVLLRKTDEITCETSVTLTITEPAALAASGTVSSNLTCTDGATIIAGALGGSPKYEYQLEDNSGNTIGNYTYALNQNNPIFTNLSEGRYIVRVRDANGCEDPSDSIEIAPLDPVLFSAAPTSCYDGNNNATITVNVTSGNGGYQFRINAGIWQTPSPADADNFTFSGLSSGSYTIEVKDQLFCPITPIIETVTIASQLYATVSALDISACAPGRIAISAIGGDGNYRYAAVPTGTTPSASDFGASNTFPVTAGNDGDYDVYVRDHNAVAPDACTYMETVTVNPATPLLIAAVPTAPECHDGLGTITVTISSGDNPYTIELIDLTNAGAANTTNNKVVSNTQTFYNLSSGNYTVIVTDANGCDRTETPVTITNPDELIANTTQILPPGCDPNPNLYGFSFNGYPSTLGALEFSADGGASWQSSDTFVGTSYASGTTVRPSIRVVGTSCQLDLPRETISYPLDDLNITLTAQLISCNNLQVTVQGTAGSAPYEYTYSEDPLNFNPATAVWSAPTPGDNVYSGLTPGRTYVFYVRDATGPPRCIRQSSVNVNDVAPPPVSIVGSVKPTCAGVANGEIAYTVTETIAGQLGGSFDWDLFLVGSPATTVGSGSISGFTSGDTFTVPTPAALSTGDYYIEIRGAAPNNCVIGSENIEVEELEPITFTPNVLQNITCANPGLIEIQNPLGGGGLYTYTVSSSNFLTDVVSTNAIIEINNTNLVDTTTSPFTVLVEIVDQYNCPVVSLPAHTVSLTMSQPPSITSVDTTNCSTPFGITINANNGTAPYLYTIDGGANYFDNGGVFNNVAPGSYTVEVLDANGCSATATAEVYPTLQASAALTKALDCTATVDAIINIGASEGSGSYEYEVSGPVNESRTAITTANSVDWVTSVSGTYSISVYDTNRPSCAPRTFTVEVPEVIRPVVRSIFTNDVSCDTVIDGKITITVENNGLAPYTFEITSYDGNTVAIAPATTTATTATFTGLAPTTSVLGYLVTVRGNASNNCTTLSRSIIIEEPDPISVTMDVPVAFGCSVANTKDSASISVLNVTGGSNNYVRYEFINDTNPSTPVQTGTNSTYIESNPLGGNYTINVYDSNGCVGTTTASIAPFVQISAPTVTTTTTRTCNSAGDAAIQVNLIVNPATATPNLSYEINGINVTHTDTNTTGSFTGLEIGNYRVTVINTDTNCTIETVHTVAPPEKMQVVATKLADEECLNNGVDEGSFSVGVSNYTGAYNYQVYNLANVAVPGLSGSGATGSSLVPITNLPRGVYYVRITQTDAPFCEEQSNAITILAPQSPISFAPTEEFGVSCSNDQGSISILPTGGEAPYTIAWTNARTGDSDARANVAAYVFNSLSAGEYTFTVTDAFGCSETATISLVQPEDIAATITATTLVCFGDQTASVTATLASRTTVADYQYQLNIYDSNAATVPTQTGARQFSDTFTNLGAGYYSITVIDNLACRVETDKIQIIAPNEVVAQLFRASPLTCTNLATLELRGLGGIAPYSYSQDGTTFTSFNETNGANTHTFTDISSGTYRYYVRDSFNCVASISNAITEDPIVPLSLIVDTTAAIINCTGERTATIAATADGGLGNYQFALYNNSSLSMASRISGPQSQGLFSGLPAGTYYVSVTSDDCTVAPQEVQITDPPVLEYTDEVQQISCFGENDGSITVNLSGGAGGYRYAISPRLSQFDTTNTFTDLAPGDYTIIAQDGNGCFEQLRYTIVEPSLLLATANATYEVCAGSEDGSITLTISGGTAPYSTSLNANATEDFEQDRLEFNNLAGGNYIVFVKDANGCETNMVVDITPGININATVTPVYECTGDIPNNYVNITLEDQTVIGDVLYALDSTDPADMQLNPDFRNISTGSHFIAVAHANGCVQTIDFEIEGFTRLTVDLVETSLNEITATANGGQPRYTYYLGDRNRGSENVFTIYKTGTYTVTVVDENGCEAQANIFMEFIDVEFPNHFTPDGDGFNDFWTPRNKETFPEILIMIFDRYGREVYRMGVEDKGWGGGYNQTALPAGDYWYVAKLNGVEDSRELIGHFTLYR